MSEFQASRVPHLESVQRPAEVADWPPEVWAMDERRWGLQTVRRRRLTLRGIKPIGRSQHADQHFDVDGAVAPRTGDGLFHARLALNGAQFQAFLDDGACARPDTFLGLIVDTARAHRAAALALPVTLALIFQPPYAPELNPCEGIWKWIRAEVTEHQAYPTMRALFEACKAFIDRINLDLERRSSNG